jgi:uncharacterized protein (TIRG00374 family)
MAEEQATPATTAGGEPDTKPRAGTGRRAILTRVGLLVGIMAVVFVLILPRVVDYGAVAAALSGLGAIQLAALAATTALAYVANASPSYVLVPGLSWPHAVGSDLAGRAVVSTIPGPTDIATRFLLYRQWAIPADIATAGIVFNAFFETLSDLILPLIATLGVLLAGHAPRPTVAALSLIGVIILVFALLLLVAIVRSESLAGRLGRLLESLAGRLWGLFRRTPPSGIAEGVMQVRERSQDMLSRRGALGFGAAVLARLAWFVVLQVSLWSVGVSSDVLAPSAVLTTMAAVALLALIPITPGAIGVSEIAYVGLFAAVAGDAMTAPITAAIVIFRFAQWFVPIPLGWTLLAIMRGSHWRELEADVEAEVAADAAEPIGLS